MTKPENKRKKPKAASPNLPAATHSPEVTVQAGTSAGTKVSVSVGIVAAMLIAFLVNVTVARHYKRWDFTRGGLYTLSDATLETLHGLHDSVKVYVLLPTGTPLTLSLDHLLDSYRAETTKLDVEFTDPDRRPAEFLAVQQRYGILVGKSDDGQVVTDAAVIVVRGDKPFFLTMKDLVEVDDEDDLKARPKLEQAVTGAIRSVLTSDKPRACFAAGHGEQADLTLLKERLVKNNFEVDDLAPAHANEKDDIGACRLLLIAGPTEKMPDEDVARFRSFIEKGGSALIAVSPAPDGNFRRFKRLNLADLLAVAGVRLNDDFVFELDPKFHLPRDFGEIFTPTPKTHPVTQPIVRASAQGVPVVLTIASSLASTGGAVAPEPLLVTSADSFGMVDFFRWSNESAPAATPRDNKGPLTVAFASELPKPPGSTEMHGPRVVVVGSSSVFKSENWQQEELRGTALFVESAIAWLSARPAIVDIPPKPAFTAGIHVSDDSLASIFRYVVIFMPLASVFLGAAVYLRRKSTERKSSVKRPRDRDEEKRR